MPKKYDFSKANRLIEEHLPQIQKASLGMYEDWFWTGEEVFNATEGFTLDLDAAEKIAGIDGSDWATPCLRLSLKTGEDKCVSCFTGDSDSRSGGNIFTLGVLSAPVQNHMPILEEELSL